MTSEKAERRRLRRRGRQYRRLKTALRFVDHPRYGDGPIRSGECHSEEEVRSAFWQYSAASRERRIIFPETAIRADLSRQYFGYSPRLLYVDIARQCRRCHRWFLFFALEQKHWFETLGFHVDADCIHCQECRHSDHDLKSRLERYQSLLHQPDKSAGDWKELSALADGLWEAGHITKPETLLKSRMPKRLRKTE